MQLPRMFCAKEISVREAGVVHAEVELDREAGLWLEID